MATESSLKMMKNYFYFGLKSLFLLKIYKLSWLFGHVEKRFHEKDRWMSKFMTPQLGKQRIATNILSNISRSKGNQTIKFGQLIEHNMRNIFLEISCTKYGRETIPRPFSKKSKLNLSGSVVESFIQFVYYMPSWGLSKYIKTCRPLAFTSYKAFLKNKRCLELISLPHFLHYFSRKIFLFLHSINWQNFIIWLPLLHVGQYVYYNCMLTRLWCHECWN